MNHSYRLKAVVPTAAWAVGVGTDFKIYQEQVQAGYYEVVEQNLNAFNAASRGSIALSSEALMGDYAQEAFFQDGPDVTRRDPDSVTAVTSNAMTQSETVSVKLHRRYEQAMARNAWLRIAKTPEMFSFIYGKQLAKKLMQEMLDTALLGANYALSGVATLNKDSSDATMTMRILNAGLAKFGDAASRIQFFVMHSKVYFDLMDNVLASYAFDNGAGIVIATGTTATLGRPVLVTDSSSLVIDGTTDTYVTLGLTAGGIEVVESESPYTASAEITGGDSLYNRLQTEWAYNLGIKGFAYDMTNGGKNPNAAAVATASNWDKKYEDRRSLAGVRIVTL